jgi:hypothetical protein
MKNELLKVVKQEEKREKTNTPNDHDHQQRSGHDKKSFAQKSFIKNNEFFLGSDFYLVSTMLREL